MRYSHPELIDQLAAKYVLGTLRPAARRRFERLQHERADVRLAVTRWQERLAKLSHSVPSRMPSQGLWLRIRERTIDLRSLPSSTQRIANTWRLWWSGAFSAAAAAMACFFILAANPQWLVSVDELAMRNHEKLPQSYVGVLSDGSGRGRLLVSSLRHGTKVTVKVLGNDPIAPNIQEASELYLWALPSSGNPVLLGKIPARGTAQLNLPDTSEKLLSSVSRLVVTRGTALETAKDARQHLLSGPCAKLW